jgi:hypothetical protein
VACSIARDLYLVPDSFLFFRLIHHLLAEPVALFGLSAASMRFLRLVRRLLWEWCYERGGVLIDTYIHSAGAFFFESVVLMLRLSGVSTE